MMTDTRRIGIGEQHAHEECTKGKRGRERSSDIDCAFRSAARKQQHGEADANEEVSKDQQYQRRKKFFRILNLKDVFHPLSFPLSHSTRTGLNSPTGGARLFENEEGTGTNPTQDAVRCHVTKERQFSS